MSIPVGPDNTHLSSSLSTCCGIQAEAWTSRVRVVCCFPANAGLHMTATSIRGHGDCGGRCHGTICDAGRRAAGAPVLGAPRQQLRTQAKC